MFELAVAHAHTSHPRAHHHLHTVLACNSRDLFHLLEAKRGATALQRGLQHDSPDTAAEIEQECAGMRVCKGQEARDEQEHELTVGRARERLVIIEIVGAGADCALVCFLDNA